MRNKILLITLFLFSASRMHAQLCVNPSQTPSSALLVCGSASFTQSTVQFCGNTTVPVPCPAGFTYTNLNPNYFRMACYAAGTLGFTIVPDDPNANFDWQLFDVTSTNPEDIFTNPGLFVACNWSSEVGETGASIDGTSLTVCNGSGQPLFSKMPDIQAGRTYMLMISNQSNSGSPYHLTFTGGSASITDAVDPHLRSARLNCDGTRIFLRLNKDLLCNTLSLDGSEFSITGGANIIGADPGDCTAFSGSDSMILFLDQPLANGNYTLTINTGSDGTTLMDICSREIPTGESIPLIVLPPQPTPLDSVKPVNCRPQYIDLFFKKPMRCNTIADDGSDFIVSGPGNPIVTGVSVNCADRNMSSVIRINFANPIVTAGLYQVQLTTGTDGNTLADECGLLTLAGGAVSFKVEDTVSARFTVNIDPSCSENKVSYLHSGGTGIISWEWDLGIAFTANVPNPTVNYPNALDHNVSLTVSNGKCTETFSQHVIVDNIIAAIFEMPSIICPGDIITLNNNSTGSIDYWDWDFGNGVTNSTELPPPPNYISSGTERDYRIRLIVGNSDIGCYDTAYHTLKVPVNCVIAVPTAFSPNNDGRNDHFYAMNAQHVNDMNLKVFNRYGEIVFFSKNPLGKWDGKANGLPQPPGVYVWMMSYKEPNSNKQVFQRGTLLLVR